MTGLSVLLLERIHPMAAEQLSAAGHKVQTADRALGEQELIERLPACSCWASVPRPT